MAFSWLINNYLQVLGSPSSKSSPTCHSRNCVKDSPPVVMELYHCNMPSTFPAKWALLVSPKKKHGRGLMGRTWSPIWSQVLRNIIWFSGKFTHVNSSVMSYFWWECWRLILETITIGWIYCLILDNLFGLRIHLLIFWGKLSNDPRNSTGDTNVTGHFLALWITSQIMHFLEIALGTGKRQ